LFLIRTFKALNGLLCADMPLRSYSLTHLQAYILYTCNLSAKHCYQCLIIDRLDSDRIEKRYILFSALTAFSALMLLVGWQEGDPACKNFCFKLPWDIVTALNVGGQGTAW